MTAKDAAPSHWPIAISRATASSAERRQAKIAVRAGDGAFAPVGRLIQPEGAIPLVGGYGVRSHRLKRSILTDASVQMICRQRRPRAHRPKSVALSPPCSIRPQTAALSDDPR